MSTYESIHAWIARQPWPIDQRSAAHITHDSRCERNLNPMTAADWHRWARAYDRDGGR